jgi:phospholipase/lecithinase/hemolysin
MHRVYLQELIGLGAKTLVVPGNLPIGCIPNYLLAFHSDKEEDYEPETGCIGWLNKFAQYHNTLLLEELEKMRKLHPGVTIIYADYYGAAMEVFISPQQYGEFKYICSFLISATSLAGNCFKAVQTVQ